MHVFDLSSVTGLRQLRHTFSVRLYEAAVETAKGEWSFLPCPFCFAAAAAFNFLLGPDSVVSRHRQGC